MWPFVVVYIALVTVVLIGGFALRRRRINSSGGSEVSATLAGRSRQDRWQVYRAVQQGRAVSDPSLAAAAVLRARLQQQFLDRAQRALPAVRVSGIVISILAGITLIFPNAMTIGLRVVLVTTNLPFDHWTEVLGSERLTGATLDRLTHRCQIIETKGESYRLRDAKARVRKPEASTGKGQPGEADAAPNDRLEGGGGTP